MAAPAVRSADKPRVLIVDDDEGIRKLLTVFVQQQGYEAITAIDGQEAAEKLQTINVDVIVTDMIMPRKNGMELLAEVHEKLPAVPVIIITGKPIVDAAVECMRCGAFDYISKPFDFMKLKDRVTKAIEQRQELMEKTASDGSFVNINHRRFFGHYRVLRILGEGNVGIVFLAEKLDNGSTKRYALKVLKPHFSHSEDMGTLPERFLNEAEAASAVKHPNVIGIEEYGVTDDEKIPYIVMEYFEGRSLKQYVINHFILDYRQKTSILRQVADALGAIHRQHITHRDIKPQNILVNDDLLIKITDFGIAKLPNSELTMTTELLGSPAYLAPEAFDTAKVDSRADIFSFGIVCYELYLGQKPFQADSIPRFARMIQTERPLEPRKIDPDFPFVLQDIMARMLKKTPVERYRAAGDIVRDLDVYLQKGDVTAGLLKGLSRCFCPDWK